MKKIFSFLAAVLFAGSMMATPYTLTFNYFNNTGSDNGNAETTLAGLFDEASMAYVDAEAPFTIDKVYLGRKYKDQATGDSIFSNIKFGTSKAAGTLKFALKNMSVDSVIVRAAMYGDSEGGDGFSVNGTPFTLSAGNKVFENVKYVPAGDITALEIVQTKAAKGRFYITAITVYPKEGGVTPPQPAIVAPYCQTEVGHLLSENPDANSYVLLSIGAKAGKTIVRIDQDAAKNTQMFDYLQVTGLASEGADVAEGGAAAMAVEFDTPTAVNDSITLEILWSTVNWEGRWMIQNVKVPATAECEYAVLVPAPVEEPVNLGAKTIAEFLELKNTKDTCILTGVVSNIQNTTYGNFDLTDESGKLYVYGLLTPAGEAKKFADLNVAENDTLTVLAIYNEYNGTPQAKNAIFVEVKKSSAPVVEPVNLGAKTIAEFLELKNTKDTCVLTGVVSNIVNDVYGNFDLTDESGKVYVYGLLTPNGENKKFAELNVAENDTLTILAIYNEFNGTPQAKNAIFVEVKKYVEPVVFSHELYGSETLPVIDKTWFATGEGWAEETNSHAEIVNDYDINVVLVDAKVGQWQSQVFVNPGFTWEVGAYYKMEFDLATNNKLGGVTVKVNNDDNNIFYYSFPNDNIFLANQTTHFVADSIYAKAEPTDGGQLIFAIGWCDANTEILISNIVITKYEAPVVAQDVEVTLSSITTPGALIWNDATATSGWWQIMGESDSYVFSLSNAGEIAQAAGTYTVADLDPDYSYISLYGATDTVDVAFADGSVTVAISEEGIVTVNGTLVGADGNNYIFNLTYKDPTAEKTVDVAIPEWQLVDDYVAYLNLFAVAGEDANGTYVQLSFNMPEGATEIAGDYTEEDFDQQYFGSYVEDANGDHRIFSATIKVVQNEAGEVFVTADILCYNNTLYKVTTPAGQGLSNTAVDTKAIKSIVNGQLIIEKKGVKYNAQGAVIRK